MRKMLLLGLGAFAFACSDPGGGGTVADGTSDASAEVSFGDTPVSTDSASGGCTNGERRCNGQIAQQCVNGAFQDLFECPSTQICEAGACRAGETADTVDTSGGTEVIVPPDPCEGKECGPDGQGGLCGTCQLPEACNPQGQCVQGCTPQCGGKECGSDLCGGSCGSCGQNEQCIQGQCEPNQVCDCNGAVCGLDNCGNSCGNCPIGSTCSGGTCVSSPAGGNCEDLIDCIYDEVSGCWLQPDEDSFNVCVDACYTASSDQGIAEFEAYLGCVDTCPPPDDDPNTTADDLAFDRCLYNQCSDVQAYCFLDGSGPLTCFEMFDCFDLCVEGDTNCFINCWESGNPAAQAALWGLNTCLIVECPDDNDDLCVDAAIQDQCIDFVTACQLN